MKTYSEAELWEVYRAMTKAQAYFIERHQEDPSNANLTLLSATIPLMQTLSEVWRKAYNVTPTRLNV